jgi:hypothetical protein
MATTKRKSTKARTKAKAACPTEGCGYNANMAEYDAALAEPLMLLSTRSHDGSDAHRDGDGFNPDKELARLRRAIHAVRGTFKGTIDDVLALEQEPSTDEDPAEHRRALQAYTKGDDSFLEWLCADPMAALKANPGAAAVLVFIAHAIENIDEHVRREGALPKAWRQRRTKAPKPPAKTLSAKAPRVRRAKSAKSAKRPRRS